MGDRCVVVPGPQRRSFRASRSSVGRGRRGLAAARITLAQLVRVAGVRWIVEESFQAGKGQVGLDQHQVRRWTSWHRFTTLALAALAVLAICAADARSAHRPAQPDMIELTVNEIRRLINVLLIRPTRSIAYRLRWSTWRRRHQARARRAHYARRSPSNPSPDHEWRLPY